MQILSDHHDGDEPASPFEKRKTEILALLAARSVVRVEISYDGYSDAGQIECISAVNASQHPVDLETGSNADDSLATLLENFAWDILAHYHFHFEDNEGGYGTFVIDVPRGVIALDHYDRVIEIQYTGTEI